MINVRNARFENGAPILENGLQFTIPLHGKQVWVRVNHIHTEKVDCWLLVDLTPSGQPIWKSIVFPLEWIEEYLEKAWKERK